MVLAPNLARQLATANRKSEEWRMRRDRLIAEAAGQGASLREIASAVGLSNPGVLRVLRRLEADHLPPRSERGAENDVDNFVVLTPNEHRLRHGGQPDA